MEVNEKYQREYNPAHPNYKRWQRARETSEERAVFVESLLSEYITPEGLKILDLGAGEGSTSKLFSQKNFVVSLENKPERIKKISGITALHPVTSDALRIPLKFGLFDIIILQDVVEHLEVSENFFENLSHHLKKNGIIYLSTPNRFSLLNIIADPHWGLPLLSLFKREQIKKYFLRTFRKSDYQRKDIAELLSLKQLLNLFKNHFYIKICTKYPVEYLFSGGKGLVWSSFHLGLIKMVNLLGLNKILISISNDAPGILNRFFTPTFYIILKKK